MLDKNNMNIHIISLKVLLIPIWIKNTRNDKIYARLQKYIHEHPSDLKLIHMAPKNELKCGVIYSSKEHVQMDYLNGLEVGLDFLPKLRKMANQ